jgi:hypothetical protein
VLALTVIQTGNSVTYFWPLSPTADFYPENPVIETAQAQSDDNRIATVGTFLGSTASAYGIRTITGHTFQPDVWSDLLKGIDPKAYQGTGRTITNPALSLSLSDGSLVSPLLDRLSADTVVASAGTAIPGPGRLPDGTPAPTPPTPGPATLLLGSDQAATVGIDRAAVRAVQVYNRQDLPGGATGVQLMASVSDASGQVLATGSVRSPAIHPGWIQIPVAGENLPRAKGALTLAVKAITGSGGPTAVALAATGPTPTVLLIGSTADDLQLTYAGDNGTVWKRLSALPRIRWASGTKVVANPAQQVAALADPTLPASTVVLSAPGPAASGKGASLSTVQDHGDGITVDVNAAGSGYLVVADWMQSGWKVSVDGAAAPLVTADHAFDGVYVSAGQHRVRFSYTGSDLTLGLLTTGASLVLLVGLYLLARIREHSTATGAPAR